MKKITSFLLVGLIFALACSVTYASPPGIVPSIKENNIGKNFKSTPDQPILVFVTDHAIAFAAINRHCLEDPGLLKITYTTENDQNTDIYLFDAPAGLSPGLSKLRHPIKFNNKAIAAEYNSAGSGEYRRPCQPNYIKKRNQAAYEKSHLHKE